MRNILFYILLLTVNSLIGQGLPQKIGNDNQIIEHDGYTISYNETCEQANWVRYVLKPSDVAEKTATRKNYFKKDKLVSTESASSSDYTSTGYDRGHLKPAADESNDQIQMNETFYMSNISPQTPSFNRGIWKKLESYTRKLVVSNDSIIVVTGGVLNDSLKTIGDNEVCVPQHYFKVLYIYNGSDMKVECYLMNNLKSDKPIINYKTSIARLELVTNLKF